jgi:hypothetical protein
MSFAGISTDNLRPGMWRELSLDELEKLKKNYLTDYRKARDLRHDKAPAAKRTAPVEFIDD